MLMPPYAPSEAGRRKTPDPTMFPTTRAVHIHTPSVGLLLGFDPVLSLIEDVRGCRS
jgi:hypothetical protein